MALLDRAITALATRRQCLRTLVALPLGTLLSSLSLRPVQAIPGQIGPPYFGWDDNYGPYGRWQPCGCVRCVEALHAGDWDDRLKRRSLRTGGQCMAAVKQ